MSRWPVAFVFALQIGYPVLAHAENPSGQLRAVVQRSTLAQPGTTPFHLKAVIAPSFDRDKDSGRTGEVEIWWAAPDKWKREVRSPEFHRVEVVNGSKSWQRNDGDFYPEWLREVAVELVDPIPSLNDVLESAKVADVQRFNLRRPNGPPIQQVNLNWSTQTGTAEVHNIQRSSVAFDDGTGLLLYTYGLGWGGEFKDYKRFHTRTVARTLNVGTPQVTAKVETLEDLDDVPSDFFSVDVPGDSRPLGTDIITETELRKNLLPMAPTAWPTLQDGVLEGNVTAWIVVDRTGKVREIDGMVSENPAINDAGRQAILKMQFTPFLVSNIPTQVLSQVTLPFRTARPAGNEGFDSARNYFERGKKAGFLAWNSTPYTLRADFQFRDSDGVLQTGHYTDTWLSSRQWLRTAEFGKSHCERSRSGDHLYRLVDGEQSPLMCLVLDLVEPIPANDTMHESDWRMKRDNVGGVQTVRLLAGYESPEGLPDAQTRGFWFDNSGLLLKTISHGIETDRSEFEEFGGIKVARHIDVRKGGKLAMQIRVTDISAPGDAPPDAFQLTGHEWTRSFTDEER